MAMSELKQKLLQIELKQIGFRESAYDAQQELFLVCPSDDRMPKIYDKGDIHFGSEYDHLVNYEIRPIVDRVNEIVAAWDRAPDLNFKDLSNFRLLNEYNGVVLAARDDSRLGYDHGLHFVTWEYSYDRLGMMYGHYTNDYNTAKEDFAVRCGLIDCNKLFNETEMILIRQGLVHLGVNYPDLTLEQNTLLGKVIEKIEMIVPEIREREELENEALVPDDGLEI